MTHHDSLGICQRALPGDATAMAYDVDLAVMRGREMDVWLQVALDQGANDDKLTRWIRHGVCYVRVVAPK